jgi:hypothetical protein
MRVEIPAYTDRWMMGDRYGEVVKITKAPKPMRPIDIAHVRLDKSGKVRRVILADCREIA